MYEVGSMGKSDIRAVREGQNYVEEEIGRLAEASGMTRDAAPLWWSSAGNPDSETTRWLIEVSRDGVRELEPFMAH